MIDTIYATKKEMSQAWDSQGKRLAITKLIVEPNVVVGAVTARVRTDKKDVAGWGDVRVVEVGYGAKKLRNMAKPLRSRLEKLTLADGVREIHGVRESAGEQLPVGQAIPVADFVKVGDIVQVQGVTKGRGFAGGMKRHGFSGGPKTHGQSDRWRAVGSVGNRTTPGRVWLGKRLPGHMGVATQTVKGLVVAHFDADSGELWLTGPVPGAINGVIAITRTGRTKKDFALDKQASGLAQVAKPVGAEQAVNPAESAGPSVVAAEANDQTQEEKK